MTKEEENYSTKEEIENKKYYDRYEMICKCGKKHIIYTQEDDMPEYYTDVHVKCDCGNYVNFDLPVN